MSQPAVVTRFAPSPTGALHIGGARTALFNWLFARSQGGRFLLRIEDTDRARSTTAAKETIFNGLNWLGLGHDGEVLFQADRANRHAEVAYQMLENGHAYKCFATPEEIEQFRQNARENGDSTLFQSPWRHTDSAQYPDKPYCIRLKTPNSGSTIIQDQVQGAVSIENNQLDDMILLRSDGSPVYMLAVVVDDHDMNVTHIIRGDDHLNNAARQMQIYHAMDWSLPVYAHIPLIHGADGKKMSKRHGAVSVEEYQKMGYPAAAMRNYLARLGWSHGNDEFFTDAQAKQWFNLKGIGKAPARFDLKKLENLSKQHIAHANDEQLLQALQDYLQAAGKKALCAEQLQKLKPALSCAKENTKTLPDVLDKGRFALVSRPFDFDEKAKEALTDEIRFLLKELTPALKNAKWSRDSLELILDEYVESHNFKFSKIASPLRAALSGRTKAPSVFDMMMILGREETLLRLSDI